MFQQVLCGGLQLGGVVGQDRSALSVSLVDQRFHLLVDGGGDGFGVGLGLCHRAADEYLALAVVVDHSAQSIAHAP